MVSHIFLADEMSNLKKGIPPQNGEKTNKQTKTPSELFFFTCLQLSNKLKAIIWKHLGKKVGAHKQQSASDSAHNATFHTHPPVSLTQYPNSVVSLILPI